MSNLIAHFDIRADDVERCRRFYERVFGWRFQAWGPPDFYMIFTGSAEAPGIHGSVSPRDEPAAKGGLTGFECTISVDDLAAARAAILEHGGRLVFDEHEIGGVGRMIRFLDTEGNSVCAMRYFTGEERACR
jgi:predicted enzyme related to lactoylglutathione lyase